MSTDNIIVSIIIPAYNEEQYIDETLRSIDNHHPPLPYEVIVVDNNSTDRTIEKAKSHGVSVISCLDGTIAAVRNYGVKVSRGKYLIFLDADVLVTEQWQFGIQKIIDILINNPLQVTGSRCLPIDETSWLNRYWFGLLKKHTGTYINSGHLITSRLLFDNIHGFTEDLTTAEDYDFCQKAKSIGAPIIESSMIPVFHVGYPTTVGEFIKRERWHGIQDAHTIESFIASKVAILAGFNLVGLIVSALIAIFTVNITPILIYLLGIYILCIVLSIAKFRTYNPISVFNTAIIFYLYITGRSLSIIDRFALRI